MAPGLRLLGLDVGTKTIGLALSDVDLIIATPLTTLTRRKFTQDAAKIVEIIQKHEVGGLVVGLPVEMDGQEGRQAQSVRTFVDNFLALHDLPVAFWDERLSTTAVERVMIETADLSRNKRAKVIDQAAAAYILQGAMDFMG